jgi:undecaprenyl diphosphate synthase
MYAFSTENWRRPPDEVRYLMGFNESLLLRRRDELHEKGVRIRFAGAGTGACPGACCAGWTSPPSSRRATGA